MDVPAVGALAAGTRNRSAMIRAVIDKSSTKSFRQPPRRAALAPADARDSLHAAADRQGRSLPRSSADDRCSVPTRTSVARPEERRSHTARRARPLPRTTGWSPAAGDANSSSSASRTGCPTPPPGGRDWCRRRPAATAGSRSDSGRDGERAWLGSASHIT